MKKSVLVVGLTLGLGLTAFGTTTDEMTITSGSTTVTIVDNGTGDLSGTAGTIIYDNSNLNGWNISFTSGTSNSPSNSPFGLDIASLTATCNGGGCSSQELDITYSDINFNTPVGIGGFLTTYSSTQTGSSGSTSQTAWFGNNNTIFSKQNVIGTVGPFTNSNAGSASGGTVAAIPNYSLTVEDVFNAGGHSASFSTDGNITATAVPEPAAISLLGGVLLVLGTRLRKRLG